MQESEIEMLTKAITEFRDDRDWKQFHNPKDLAISLVLEATELLEIFQWKTSEEIKSDLDGIQGSIGEELADVLYWTLLLANDLGIDIKDAFHQKMSVNEKKYPVAQAKSSKAKYTEYMN